MSRSRRRPVPGRVLLWFAPLAVADSASPLEASYQAGSSWGTGYSGQYTITNAGTSTVTGWTLAFTLPAGTSLTSLWDGTYTDHGGQVTVTSDSWDAAVTPGGTATVGFEASSSGPAGQPSGCTINGAAGTVGATGPGPSESPTSSRPATTTPTASASTTPPTTTPTSAPTPTASAPSDGSAGFAPYVDTSLFPPFGLVSTAKASGVKQFNLAFVVNGGGGSCTPEWGAMSALGSDPVAAQIGALRAIGGDVRISFGGEAGSGAAVRPHHRWCRGA